MQRKKEAVRSAILNSARTEFLAKGFKSASLRSIVKSAGTTTGNFYNYFKNKEDLFSELVTDDYKNFIYFVENHDMLNSLEQLLGNKSAVAWRNVLGSILKDFAPNFDIGFVLLVDCSEGTKYSDARERFIKLIEFHVMEHAERIHRSAASRELVNIIARQFIDGLIMVLRTNNTGERKEELLIDLILFYVFGTIGIVGNF